MAESTMLSKVKLALRINHTLLDSDITESIAMARAEMVRAGIDDEIVEDETDVLITSAIKAYCLWKFSNNDKMADGYLRSWEYQIDNLRKSSDYIAEV